MAVTLRKHPGTIRSATLADAAALARLATALDLEILPLGIADLAACLDSGHLLVLDLGNGVLGAAAHVAVDHVGDSLHGRVELFAIHPAMAGTGAENRMTTALLAVVEAAGCAEIDIVRGR